MNRPGKTAGDARWASPADCLLGECGFYYTSDAPASSDSTSSRTSAQAAALSSLVNSAGLWLIPPTLGAKIMAVGQRGTMLWASCPAPEVIRRQERPRRRLHASIRSTMPLSNSTGSKRESTLRFYQKAGYRDDLKTGFCRKLD